MTPRVNVADAIADHAAARPDAVAVVESRRGGYRSVTFGELDADANRIAAGLIDMGVRPGTRLALLVPCGIEFVTLVIGLLRSGATMILIDPGMGRTHLVDCLAAVDPEGFVAIPRAQMVRTLLRHRFSLACYNVTVGRRWLFGSPTYNRLKRHTINHLELPSTAANDPAAIVFTSGSTGPPKGVLYQHKTFCEQATQIRQHFGIEPGGIDLACFPLFGLLNATMGVTTVFPRMDFSRPAACDPETVLAAANDWQVTQAFASPAVWDKLSRHCEASGRRIATLKRVFSCGAPVPAAVIRRTLACVHSEATLHTPYGATEALPVASISSATVLAETAAASDAGRGVCVGKRFASIDWKVIAIDDTPLKTLEDAVELPPGEIGELVVRGNQVTTRYVTCTEWNARAKIADGDTIWHRMGDVGYLDEEDRFWYCGRLNHRVETAAGRLFTIPVEGIANSHPLVHRSALVGLGQPGSQQPCLVVVPEPTADGRRLPDAQFKQQLREYLAQHELTAHINEIVIRPALPVDVRHNSKINREQLATELR